MVGVAQLVEHLVVVQDVAGSSPVTHPQSVVVHSGVGSPLPVRTPAKYRSRSCSPDAPAAAAGQRLLRAALRERQSYTLARSGCYFTDNSEVIGDVAKFAVGILAGRIRRENA
jgi:hypothetical protein